MHFSRACGPSPSSPPLVFFFVLSHRHHEGLALPLRTRGRVLGGASSAAAVGRSLSHQGKPLLCWTGLAQEWKEGTFSFFRTLPRSFLSVLIASVTTRHGRGAEIDGSIHSGRGGTCQRVLFSEFWSWYSMESPPFRDKILLKDVF